MASRTEGDLRREPDRDQRVVQKWTDLSKKRLIIDARGQAKLAVGRQTVEKDARQQANLCHDAELDAGANVGQRHLGKDAESAVWRDDNFTFQTSDASHPLSSRVEKLRLALMNVVEFL